MRETDKKPNVVDILVPQLIDEPDILGVFSTRGVVWEQYYDQRPEGYIFYLAPNEPTAELEDLNDLLEYLSEKLEGLGSYNPKKELARLKAEKGLLIGSLSFNEEVGRDISKLIIDNPSSDIVGRIDRGLEYLLKDKSLGGYGYEKIVTRDTVIRLYPHVALADKAMNENQHCDVYNRRNQRLKSGEVARLLSESQGAYEKRLKKVFGENDLLHGQVSPEQLDRIRLGTDPLIDKRPLGQRFKALITI